MVFIEANTWCRWEARRQRPSGSEAGFFTPRCPSVVAFLIWFGAYCCWPLFCNKSVTLWWASKTKGISLTTDFKKVPAPGDAYSVLAQVLLRITAGRLVAVSHVTDQAVGFRVPRYLGSLFSHPQRTECRIFVPRKREKRKYLQVNGTCFIPCGWIQKVVDGGVSLALTLEPRFGSILRPLSLFFSPDVNSWDVEPPLRDVKSDALSFFNVFYSKELLIGLT